eukprot:jgi/Mesvir1/13221/Mv19891-RA.1
MMIKVAMPDEALRKGGEAVQSASLAALASVSSTGATSVAVNGCFRGEVPANGNSEASDMRHALPFGADEEGGLHQRSLDEHGGKPSSSAEAEQAKTVDKRASAEENQLASGRGGQDGDPGIAAPGGASEPSANREGDASVKDEGRRAAGDARGAHAAGSSKRKYTEVDAPEDKAAPADDKAPDGGGSGKGATKEDGKEECTEVNRAGAGAAGVDAPLLNEPKSAPAANGEAPAAAGAAASGAAGGGEAGGEGDAPAGVHKPPLMRLWGWHKKPRLVWSAELHEVFLVAISQVGLEHVVPTTILRAMQDMGVTGLTREQVSSHLQKYRQQVVSGDATAGAPGRLPPGAGFPEGAARGGEGGSDRPADAEGEAAGSGMAAITIDPARKAQAFAAAKYVSSATTGQLAETAGAAAAPATAGDAPAAGGARPVGAAPAVLPPGVVAPPGLLPGGMLPPGVLPPGMSAPGLLPPGMYPPGMLDWGALQAQAMMPPPGMVPPPGMMPPLMGMGVGPYAPPVMPGGRYVLMNRWPLQGTVPGPAPAPWYNAQMLVGHPGFAMAPGAPYAPPSGYLGMYPPGWDGRVLGPMDMAMLPGMVPVDGTGAPLASGAPAGAGSMPADLRSLASEAAASSAAAAATTTADAVGGRLLSAVLAAAGGEPLVGTLVRPPGGKEADASASTGERLRSNSAVPEDKGAQEAAGAGGKDSGKREGVEADAGETAGAS